jgi:acyl CoA:acetate/3-ketoacid CoA transferase beta subunit
MAPPHQFYRGLERCQFCLLGLAVSVHAVNDYNAIELMICAAARLLANGSTVAVGTGMPCAAAMLAQKTHAPDLFIVFEAGGLASLLPTMPISVGDSRTTHRGLMATGMCDVMDACQRGMIDYTFLGGAQIDAFGNLNSTVLGDHGRPKVRFPGSGGANDFASLCWHTLVITNHDHRRFVERLDFLTSPGYLTGPGAREAAGLPFRPMVWRTSLERMQTDLEDPVVVGCVGVLHRNLCSGTCQWHQCPTRSRSQRQSCCQAIVGAGHGFTAQFGWRWHRWRLDYMDAEREARTAASADRIPRFPASESLRPLAVLRFRQSGHLQTSLKHRASTSRRVRRGERVEAPEGRGERRHPSNPGGQQRVLRDHRGELSSYGRDSDQQLRTDRT